MHATDALAASLRSRGQPVITEYTLFVVVRGLYAAGHHEGHPLNIRKQKPSLSDASRLRRWLLNRNYLEPDPDFAAGVYRVVQTPDAPAEGVCCLVDPFCYTSHFSAMQHYGLTERVPAELSLTTPTTRLWRQMAEERMKADYGSPVHGRIPEPVEILQKHTFAEKIRGRIVVRHEAKEPDAPIAIRDTFARISTIGRTFADTLSEPGWCGGMRHVLDVWQRHALTYLEEIVKAVDSSTRPIVKVRAGYILDELLGIKDARIDAWLAFAARGGSRKLDPDHSWLSRWSEKWMLSLNA